MTEGITEKLPRFRLVAQTQADEDAFNLREERKNPNSTGMLGSVAHIVKAALGAGILSSHVAYMKGGYAISMFLTVFFGIYLGYCLWLLVKSAQTMCKRTHVASMLYPDVGEACFACSHSPKLRRRAKVFRYMIDIVICIELFGACACYQLIIAKTIKQLVEDTLKTSLEPQKEGYPHLRIYLLIIIIPCILICLLRQLNALAPFSIVANGVVVLCLILTVYYSFKINPNWENLIAVKDFQGLITFCGMLVFSMSCCGPIISIETNMTRPELFTPTFIIGMGLIIVLTIGTAFFGYVAYLEDCESPITVNFPMEIMPKILKGLIAFMIYVTHALNFWVPFNLTFHYLKKWHRPERHVMWEYIYRALFVFFISAIAIAFPSINALMGFLGTFSLCCIGFIFPNIIYLATVWERPGFGKFKWRLVMSIFLIMMGIFLFVAGSFVNGGHLISMITK